jgi:hypothetical protein
MAEGLKRGILGLQHRQRHAADGQLDVAPEPLKRVRNIVARLIPAARYERPDGPAIRWEIHTCRHCDEQASAMAGGKLLVGEEFIAELDKMRVELTPMSGAKLQELVQEVGNLTPDLVQKIKVVYGGN